MANESDSVLFSSTKVNAHQELWTIRALSVDGVEVPLRGFRKSHHFVVKQALIPTAWIIGECSPSRRGT